MVGATALMPALTYGTGGSIYYNTSCDTNAATTGGYHVARWSTTNAVSDTATYPIEWDTGTAATGIIQFRILDVPWVVQHTEGPTYIRYDNADTCWYYNYGITPAKTPKERLREILDSRMAPGVLSSCKPLGYTQDVRELRARETLQRVLGEDKFRDFVRRGHVTVRAKSGLVYQIFPGHEITRVYDRGKMVERLCVVLTGEFPPTDSLIMRYLMILNNEQQFRSYAIKHGVIQPQFHAAAEDQRSLAEIYRELKKAA